MTRPSPGKSRVRTPSSRPAPARRIGNYSVTGSLPAQSPVTLTFSPSHYPDCMHMADLLGSQWERHGRSQSFVVARMALAGLKLFLDWCSQVGVRDLAQLTPTLLREAEAMFIEVSSSGAGRHASAMWGLLSGLPSGVLSEGTSIFVTHAPAIPDIKSDPTEALPDVTKPRTVQMCSRVKPTASAGPSTQPK